MPIQTPAEKIACAAHARKLFLRASIFAVSAVLSIAFFAACGGGGASGGNDDIKIEGTIVRASAATTTTAAASALTRSVMEGKVDLSDSEDDLIGKAEPTVCPTDGRAISICARESCSESSLKGEWTLSVAAYGGGDLEFTFIGCGVKAKRTVRRINRNSQDVTIDFAVASEKVVNATSICQYDREGFAVPGTTSTCVVTTSTTLAK